MNQIDAEFNMAFQHLSNLSALATQADLSGDQLSDFIETKHKARVMLIHARNKIAYYLGVK